jgi:hypothetical protein
MIALDPCSHTGVKQMLSISRGDQGVHIEKVDHGKSISISAPSSLVRMGAFGPRLRTGRPVTGSVIISAFSSLLF